MKFRKDIDGLRGINVLFVIIYHYNNNILKGGFVGVDIFFLISGYKMKRIINFYVNRIKRIIPVSYIVLLCAMINIYNLKENNPNDIQTDVRSLYLVFQI